MCDDALTPELKAELSAEIAAIVEAHAASPPPTAIYHYTTPVGLHGILQSGQVHFTDAFFLNDQSEVTYGRDVVIRTLSRRLATERNRRYKLMLSPLLQVMTELRQPEGIDDFHCYVACFCHRGDLLSQWRAYGAPGHGYSIGFSTSQLRSVEPRITLRRVIYAPNEQQAVLNGIVTGCIEAMDRRCAQTRERKPRHDTFGYYRYALSIAIAALLPQLKHPVFEEEQEWRLIALHLEKPPNRIQFRHAAAGLVPFQAIDLRCHGPEGEGLLPITNIVHGPCAEPALRKRSIRLLLESAGYGWPRTVPIEGSDIPLRSV